MMQFGYDHQGTHGNLGGIGLMSNFTGIFFILCMFLANSAIAKELEKNRGFEFVAIGGVITESGV